jgi:signal transduction histidine kinase
VLVADAGLAAFLLVLEMIASSVSPDLNATESRPTELLYNALGLLPVVIRRRWIGLAVLLAAVHAALPFVGIPLRSAAIAVLVVTYTAAVRLPIRPATAALFLVWAPSLILSAIVGPPYRGDSPLSNVYYVAFSALSALVSFLVGRTVATRRAYVAALEDRARTAETSQQALTDQAVAEERRRIARELHDVVAHHVSVMGVLATGSRRMLARDPAAADEALATIEATGRTALREMRRLLTVLRADAEPAGELAPQPGLAGVEGLVEQMREAGLPAALKVEGVPGPLDPGVALTVYRIVQEALTNALKHAGAAAVEVRLLFAPHELIVEICDTGRGPQLGANAVGHGLLGMRERVMLYGGTLRTGPRPGGGYRVYAKIPVDSTERQLAS